MSVPFEVLNLFFTAINDVLKEQFLGNVFYKAPEFKEILVRSHQWSQHILSLKTAQISMCETVITSIRKEALALALPIKRQFKGTADRDEYFVLTAAYQDLQHIIGMCQKAGNLLDAYELSGSEENRLAEMKEILHGWRDYSVSTKVTSALKKLLKS